jgi:hypothetical protein
VFVLDTNVFLEASKRYYAFDIAPAFWRRLVALASSGQVLSIDRVQDELTGCQDAVSAWATNDFGSYFVDTRSDKDVILLYANLIKWAYAHSQFSQAAKDEFAIASNADAWLVAYAKVHDCILVTHEEFGPTIQRKIPIPNVCRDFGVTVADTFEMLRQLGVSFHG